MMRFLRSFMRRVRTNPTLPLPAAPRCNRSARAVHAKTHRKKPHTRAPACRRRRPAHAPCRSTQLPQPGGSRRAPLANPHSLPTSHRPRSPASSATTSARDGGAQWAAPRPASSAVAANGRPPVPSLPVSSFSVGSAAASGLLGVCVCVPAGRRRPRPAKAPPAKGNPCGGPAVLRTARPASCCAAPRDSGRGHVSRARLHDLWTIQRLG